MTLGARIRSARDVRKLTQAELALRVGVQLKTISRYETDEHPPRLGTLEKLADALGVSTDFLIRGDAQSTSSASARRRAAS